MPRRMRVHRPRPATVQVPYPEFELGCDQVCPTPETLAHLREILHEEGELGATAREEERKETVDTQTNVEDDEKGEDVEARRVFPARASEPQTSTAENPRSRDHLAPVILSRRRAPAPIEVASLELVQQPPTPARDTAPEDTDGLNTEE